MMREGGEAVGGETPVGMGLVFLKEQDQLQPLLRKQSSCNFLESVDIGSYSLLPKYHLYALFVVLFQGLLHLEHNKCLERDLRRVGWKKSQSAHLLSCLGLSDIVCPMFKIF